MRIGRRTLALIGPKSGWTCVLPPQILSAVAGLTTKLKRLTLVFARLPLSTRLKALKALVQNIWEEADQRKGPQETC